VGAAAAAAAAVRANSHQQQVLAYGVVSHPTLAVVPAAATADTGDHGAAAAAGSHAAAAAAAAMQLVHCLRLAHLPEPHQTAPAAAPAAAAAAVLLHLRPRSMCSSSRAHTPRQAVAVCRHSATRAGAGGRSCFAASLAAAGSSMG
jgi:hypothetical protein